MEEKKQNSPCSLCANARKHAARNNRNIWFQCSLSTEEFDECCKSGCKKNFKKRLSK